MNKITLDIPVFGCRSLQKTVLVSSLGSISKAVSEIYTHHM